MAIYTKKVSRQSSHSLLAPTASTMMKGMDGMKKSNHEKLRLQLQLSGIRQQDISFVLDDTVDGICILPNGTQRWYPGRISLVNSDGTYSVKFMDGDVHDNKVASEIRHTKNSKLSSARSNKNIYSSSDSHSHIPLQSNQDTSRATSIESSPKSTCTGFPNASSTSTSNGMHPTSASARNLGLESHGLISFANCPDTLSMDGNSYSTSNGDVRSFVYRHPSSRTNIGINGTPRLTDLTEKSPIRTSIKENIMIKSPRMHAPTIAFECRGAAQRTLSALLAVSNMKRPDTGCNVTILAKSSDSDQGIKSPGSSASQTLLNQVEVEVVSRRAPFLGQRPSHRKSWKSEDSRCSADSYESDGQTFTIPSVFPKPRTERKADGECKGVISDPTFFCFSAFFN